jgi:DNA-binding XRE family transcriptional regulator
MVLVVTTIFIVIISFIIVKQYDYFGEKMNEINERYAYIRKNLSLNRKQFAYSIDIAPQISGDIELGKREPSRDVLIKLATTHNVNINWLLLGKGPVFLRENSNLDASEIIEIENKNGVINVGNDNKITTGQYEKPDPSALISAFKEKTMMVFEIPLLTREQALRFYPTNEIPNPKAYSGEYPDYTLVPIPRRLQEYGTDLRAIVVFNGLMAPLLNPGDVAIFQATGWSGDGVYVYRMCGDLHIGQVRSVGKDRLTEKIVYDAGSFEAIGQVRAVVKEIGAIPLSLKNTDPSF